MNTLQAKFQGRQAPLVAVAPFTYADIDGANFTPAFEVPAKALILRGGLVITSATNAANIEVGTATDADALLTATSGAAAGRTAFDGDDAATEESALGALTTYGVTASAPLTQGEGYIWIEYVVGDRAHCTQG